MMKDWNEINKKEFERRNNFKHEVYKVYLRNDDDLVIYILRLPYTPNKLENTKDISWDLFVGYQNKDFKKATYIGNFRKRGEARNKLINFMRNH